jgi:hypothetical protein
MTSTSRVAAGLLAGGLALGALGGCTFTSNGVSCSTSSCTVTLSGDGAQAEVLGTTVTLGSVQDGRASLEVGGASVSCAEGESVAAGPLSVECTSVTEDAVELTATVA